MSGQPETDQRPEADQPDQETAAEAAGGAGDEHAETPDPEAERARADENWDKYLRAMAELDNVRKRAARDIENARRFSLEPFARELLAVRDSLELGLNAAADAESLREGIQATLKLLALSMEQFGIVELDPLGAPFDPQEHEAMMMQPSADAEPGTVLTVYQKGYSLHGRLLRPARVVVAAETGGAGPEDDAG
jgi:molecular chaperone GrpE